MSKPLYAEHYYTAKEAMERLGVSRNNFYFSYAEKILKSYVPPGRRYGLYRKIDVDDLALEMQAFAATSGHTTATFTKCLTEDMEETAKLINAIFNTYPNVEVWKSWIERNPDIGYLLKADDKIIGCAFLIPLTRKKIEDILSHEVTTPTKAEEILPFTRGVPIHLYARTVGIQPGISKTDRRLWGSRLVASLMKVIIDLGRRGVPIEMIWSRSETPDGIRILRHMGFTEIPSITNSRNFIIDVAHSGIPVIQEYKAAFNQRRATLPNA